MITADSYTVTGRRPSPAAVALLVQCRKARALADSAQLVFRTETPRPVATAAGGEVTIVVRPTSLAEWARWAQRLGAREPGKSTGTQMVVRCRYGGVRTRLVGVGVPQLLAAAVTS